MCRYLGLEESFQIFVGGKEFLFPTHIEISILLEEILLVLD